MLDVEFDARVDDQVGFHVIERVIGVGDVVNPGAGVGACEHKAHFADQAVENIISSTLQNLRPDRQRINVAVLERVPHVLRLLGLVEAALGVDAIVALLESRVSEDHRGVRVVVLVDERDLSPVLLIESALADRETVRALQIVLGGVPTKVKGVHVLLLSLGFLLRRRCVRCDLFIRRLLRFIVCLLKARFLGLEISLSLVDSSS